MLTACGPHSSRPPLPMVLQHMGIVSGPRTLSSEQSCKAGRQGYGLSVSRQLEANRNALYDHSHLEGELQHLLQSVYMHKPHTHKPSHGCSSETILSPISLLATETQRCITVQRNEWHRLFRLRFWVTHVTNTSAQNPASSGHKGTN